jgi:hypothetical protein
MTSPRGTAEPPFYLVDADPADIDRVIEAEERAIAELNAIAAQEAQAHGYTPDPDDGWLKLAERMALDHAYFGSYAEAQEYFDQVVARERQLLADELATDRGTKGGV